MLVSSNFFGNKKEIVLSGNESIGIYQKDNFFCLSDTCKDLGVTIADYLLSPRARALFANHGECNFPSSPSMNKLLKLYPNLVKYSRSPHRIDSGVWLSNVFYEDFLAWTINYKQINWHKYASSSYSQVLPYERSLSVYNYLLSKPLKIRSVFIREEDGFVNALAIYQGARFNLRKMLEDSALLVALKGYYAASTGKTKTFDLTPEALGIQIYHQFLDYLDVTDNGNEKTFLWIHPEVIKLYAPDDTQLQSSIDDWYQRVGDRLHDERLHICNLSINIDSQLFAKKLPSQYDNKLVDFLPTGCEVTLVETIESMYLKVTAKDFTWSFAIDLLSKIVFVDAGLLVIWGLELDDVALPDVYTWMVASSIFGKNNILLRMSSYDYPLFSLQLDWDIKNSSGSIYFSDRGKPQFLHCPIEFAQAMDKVTKFVNDSLVGMDANNIRFFLAKQGFTSPFIKQVNETAIVPVTDSLPYLTIAVVNGVEIRQRNNDGFIDATAMAVAHDKDLSHWLRNEEIFKLFASRAKLEGIKFKSPDLGTSNYIRVAETFPELIDRKQGSPKNGGGTWLHPKLSYSLAMWCDSDFGALVQDIVDDWMRDRRSKLA